LNSREKGRKVAQIVISRWWHCPKIIASEMTDMRALWWVNWVAEGS
jgi:hypothetical protein